MMDKETLFQNGILVIDNFFSDSKCNQLIELFHNCDKVGLTCDRKTQQKVDKSIVNDNSLFIEDTLRYTKFKEVDLYNHCELLMSFRNSFWQEAYQKYTEKWFMLDQYTEHKLSPYKLQQTKPCEGYHVWHCESMDRSTSDRILSYILYLNTVVDGGETEFLHQSARIPAEKGRLVIFPTSFLHTHRGNPPLNSLKYIMTGWVVFS